MKKLVLIFSSLFVSLTCQSCSHITLLRVQELKQVQAHVDSLSVQVSSNEAKILENQKAQGELLRVIRADMQVKFGDLDKRLGTLENGISESQYRLSKIDEKNQQFQQRWEEKTKADSSATGSKAAETEKLFQLAFSDFTAGRYDLALSGFLDLIKRFPESAMVEESYYWVGECYYVQKNYIEAEKAYINYIKLYPTGKKICAALYKLGLVYQSIGNKSKSQKMVWDKLKTQCPDSEEAKAVKGAGQ